MKKILIVLFTLILFSGCSKEKSEDNLRPVEIFKIENFEDYKTYSFPAITVPEKETNLSFKIPGPIVKINVDIGSFVQKGDVLALMDKRDFQVKLKTFESQSLAAKNFYEASVAVANNAKSQFARVEKLYKNKNIPKKSYEEAIAKRDSAISSSFAALSTYEASRQLVENAKNNIDDTSLKAPFSGYITKKFYDEGANLAPGLPLFSLTSDKNNKVRINVSDKIIDEIKNIKKATFTYNDKTYSLKLENASQIKGFGNIAYPITFKILDENTLPPSDIDGEVKLYFKTNNLKGFKIPINSIFEKNQKTSVWIYKDEQVSSREIKVLELIDEGFILVDGLNMGEQIVTKGIHQLSENEKVTVLKAFSKTNVGNIL